MLVRLEGTMTRCHYCGQPAELAYHAECWAERNERLRRQEERIMYEAHDAIQELKNGRPVHVSSACMERYGANIAYWRERGGK